MPQRLREKIRTVTLEPHVNCKIEPLYPGSPTEKCVFRLTASAGRVVEDWDGAAWVERGDQKGGGDLLMVDRSQADQVAALMAPLELKAEPYGKGLARKINKQFPDLFSQWLQSLPAFCKVELHGELEQFRNASVSGVVHLEVEEDSLDWFNLKVVVKVEDVNLTPEEIRLLLNAKGRFVRLPEKGWRRLEFDLSAEEDAQLARLGLSPHELSDQPQRLHALQLADPAARRFLADDQAKRVELRAADIKARVTPEIPAGIQATLRPYQRDGFHFLAYLTANHFGGILADDMGLGKTLQALTWLKWQRETLPSPIPPSLVVCPKSVMDNWHAEAERFVPGLRVKIWTASEFADFQNGLAAADLHVVNYSQLRLAEDVVKAAAWLVVILDEGQFIKNPNSQTAQAARALKAQYRLVLSGTPIENRLLDLWSLMAFAMPGLLGTRAEFGRIYDAKNDPLARQRLSARVRPFLLRRTKTQVAKDLPDRIEEDIYCELEGEQKTLYRAELKAAQQLLLKVQTQKELNQYRFNFLTSLLRLRQICCHPALVDPKSKLIGAKTEALFDQLEPLMEEGQKVLVFSQFVELINLLDPMIQARQWPVFRLTGETENRGDLVKAFQKQDGPAVFLLSLKAGGFGLNLTAAGYVVLFDPWWNPAVERQAIDRTHRIGQTRKVIAYRLLIKDSIEEKIRRLQKQKAALAEDVLGEEKFAQNLTMADLRYLFSDAPTAAA
jgi:SNF2 family DNA or RNA helicase